MKRILAIRFARLGDVILLLPALAAIKASLPDAHISFLTGHRYAAIGQMCPAIDEVIAVDRVAMRDGSRWRAIREMKKLVSDIRRRNFDVVIDFHSFRETNLLTWLSRAPVRFGMRRFNGSYLGFCFNRPPVDEDKSVHVSEMFRRVSEALPGVDSTVVGDVTIKVPDKVREQTKTLLPREPRIAMYIDAPVEDRKWPVKSFEEVADHATRVWGAQPIVLGSPSSGVRPSRRLPYVFTDFTLPELCAAIASSCLLISNDTGPMHLGPALGIPTLGLFSVGLPGHFRPSGKHDRFLKADSIGEISVAQVLHEMDQMWTIAGPGLPR